MEVNLSDEPTFDDAEDEDFESMPEPGKGDAFNLGIFVNTENAAVNTIGAITCLLKTLDGMADAEVQQVGLTLARHLIGQYEPGKLKVIQGGKT
jgi:hypothetical protein